MINGELGLSIVSVAALSWGHGKSSIDPSTTACGLPGYMPRSRTIERTIKTSAGNRNEHPPFAYATIRIVVWEKKVWFSNPIRRPMRDQTGCLRLNRLSGIFHRDASALLQQEEFGSDPMLCLNCKLAVGVKGSVGFVGPG